MRAIRVRDFFSPDQPMAAIEVEGARCSRHMSRLGAVLPTLIPRKPSSTSTH
jgi:hypothetical protein